MDKRKKITLCAVQLAIITMFTLFALGSASSEPMARGMGQGLSCSAMGYTFIGYYDSDSKCSRACSEDGYSTYCTGDNTTSCYCK